MGLINIELTRLQILGQLSLILVRVNVLHFLYFLLLSGSHDHSIIVPLFQFFKLFLN